MWGAETRVGSSLGLHLPRAPRARARAGLRGRSRRRQRNPSPPPQWRFGGNWDILTRRTRCNGAEVGGHGDRVLGGARGAGLGRPAQPEKEQARGELSLALVLAAADGLSQDGRKDPTPLL